MMKKNYQKPATREVSIQHSGIICASGPVDRIAGNADLNYEGGGSGTARARSFDAWDDDEEE